MFWSILLNYNGVVIPLTNQFDGTFSIVDVAFKSSVDKLIPISNLISWKKNKSVGYSVVCSYK